MVSSWEGQTWTPHQPAAYPDGNPNFILESALTYHPLQDYFVVFGGELYNHQTGGYTSGQTWIWDRAGWTLLEPEDLAGDEYPSHRQKHVSGWDPITQTIQVVSGFDYWQTSNNGSYYTNGAQWSFDGAAWTKVEPDDPEGDGNPTAAKCGNMNNRAYEMALDTDREMLNVVGCPSGFIETVWQWNGSSWKNVIPADPENDGSPGKRIGASLAYDSGRERLVYFGGEGADDLWEWEAGIDARPGHVYRYSLVSLGVEEVDTVRSLGASAIAGGKGVADEQDGYGVDLSIWDGGTWSVVDTQTHLAQGSAGVHWETSEPGVIERLPVTDGRWIGLALTPIHPNGPEYGVISSSYGELTVSYRRNDE